MPLRSRGWELPLPGVYARRSDEGRAQADEGGPSGAASGRPRRGGEQGPLPRKREDGRLPDGEAEIGPAKERGSGIWHKHRGGAKKK